MEEAEKWQGLGEEGLTQAKAKARRQQEKWLVSEVALETGWVWEHWVLINGASATFALIQNRLVQMPTDHPLELDQVVRMGRLLVGHQWYNVVAPESWWEVAADVEKELPGLAEVLAMVRAQMEVDLEFGGVGKGAPERGSE
ncbi:hypothetical protein E4T56_gene5445 [Termitomyces sp. T112]|nr:hypothetical protein E4T56_gene5445 [Termitomyces sp. T112]